MKKIMVGRLTVFILCLLSGASGLGSHGVDQQQGWGALLQSWSKELDASVATSKAETPVTRVVNLLKEMQATLQKDMDEDEALFDKLGCWCNNNRYEKDAAITAATAKIAELESTIKASTAKSAELTQQIKETEADVAAAKAGLAEATAQRAKEAKEFRNGEKESLQNLDSVSNAIKVLSQHAGAALPQFSISLLQRDNGEDIPWSDDHESHLERSFNEFMSHSGLSDGPPSDTFRMPHSDELSLDAQSDGSRFLQKEEPRAPTAAVAGWSAMDTAVVRRAMKAATAFAQQKHGGEFMVGYAPQSGEILGILKQLKDEMEASLSASQAAEKEAAANFNEMRRAKTAEIENGETMAERKEDELADTNNALAEAKEDLDQTTAVLTADQKFMVNLKATCTDADAAFEKRKAARLQEIKAVAETIEILTADEAKDTMDATFNAASFIQTASTQHRQDTRRQRAAAVLRKAGSPELSVLATTVELDAFTRVKKAIDDMIAQLKTQQADEVKKKDWCDKELQSNDMNTMKASSLKDELDVKISDLASTIEKLNDETTQAKKDIAQLQLELQRASENRKQANMDFQKTISEQVATQEVLHTALERLAKFYDADFAQLHAKAESHRQTPPVAQAKYEKNAGASGVMSMIEKLIHEAKDLEKDARKGEQEEQAQYEALVEDTNGSVKSLQKLIVTKTAEKAEASKEKIETEGDLKDTEAEIEGLGKYNADLHGECDYVLDNFTTRQEARQQEVEALQQAKSILSGASAR